MSFRLMQDCYDMNSDLSSTEQAVLMALCRFSDEKGSCFPSVAEISRGTHLTKNTVRKAIQSLEKDSWLSFTQQAGKQRFFLINVSKISESQPLTKSQPLTNLQPLAKVEGDPLQICKETPYKSVSRIEHLKEHKENNKTDARPKAEPSVRGVSEKLVEIYNQTTKGYFPQVKALTDKRRQVCKKWIAFFRKQSNSANVPEFLEHAREYFISATQLTFLTGNNDRGWKADFDFLMNVNKTVMLLEGKYANKKSQEQIAQEKHDALWKLPTPANNSPIPTPEQLEGSFQDFALAFSRITTKAS